MSSDYRLTSDNIFKVESHLNEAHVKKLSAYERRVLQVAIANFHAGADAVIPVAVAHRLSLAEKPHTVHEANRVMWKMMGNVKAVEGKEPIVIVGQILADGRGDWAAIRNMHKVLSKKYPGRPIQIIVSSAERWRDKLDVSGLEHVDLIYYGNNPIGAEKVPLEAFPEDAEILKKAQEASILITAGVGINEVFESIRDEIKDKSFKMVEQDLVTASNRDVYSDTNEIGSTIILAGLNVSDDRMGVFTNSYSRDYRWSDLSNPKILSTLFNSEQPSEQEIEAYQASHECFFGYTNQDIAKQVFVQDAINFAMKHSPDKKVDICIPGICNHKSLGMRESFFKYFNLFEQDVGKVHLVWYDGIEKKERTMVINKNIDREIRIIDPGTISNRDFKIMTNISAPLVACTGDNSLAQAISYGKIPCYEPRFNSKVAGLMNKIKEVQGKDSALYKYCSAAATHDFLERDWTTTSLDGLAEEAKQFGEYIRNESNLKPVLNGVVNEKLLRQKDPDFAQKQDQLMQQYLDNTITRAELGNQFTALLKEKGLLQ